MTCPLCRGSGWVCVNHDFQPWDECMLCEADEGMACFCNPERAMPSGTEIIASVDDPKLH